MKSAKEWATEVVIESGWIENGDASVAMCQSSQVEKARGIISRLVERVQADARMPLVALLSELRDELRQLQRVAHHGSTAEDICERMLPKIEEALG